jgi:hypothetical protein
MNPRTNFPANKISKARCCSSSKCTAFDLFAKFQDLFDAKFDGALGRVLPRIKRFGNKNWEEFEAPVLQKEVE